MIRVLGGKYKYKTGDLALSLGIALWSPVRTTTLPCTHPLNSAHDTVLATPVLGNPRTPIRFFHGRRHRPGSLTNHYSLVV